MTNHYFYEGLIPQLVGETSRYDLRNIMLSLYFLRKLQFFKTLVFHRLLKHGIALTISIVIVKHTDLFATELKNDLKSSVKIPNYYHKGNRQLAILHCRLCNRWSDVHADL